ARLRALRALRYRGRRRLPDRLHLRHHRGAEGNHAFPPRHARDLRQLRPPRAARAGQRPLHRLTAARLHLRTRRPRALSAAGRPRRGADLHVRAAAVLIEKAAPDDLLAAIARHRATICFTAPTAYRAMLGKLAGHDLSALRKCVSAGEALPKATFEAWLAATGIKILDGIGATEMLHIFIGSPEEEIRPGATGKAVPGYEARVVDADGKALPPSTIGHLAVRGPTGCRYLADRRQR